MFDVRSNIRDVERDLGRLSAKELPLATAIALTKTASGVKSDLVAEMRAVFDRPVPFTLRGLYVKPATRTDLNARVYFRTFAPKGTPAGKYLQAQIFGGARAQKSSEKALVRGGYMPANGFWVPGPGVKLNRYGNVPGSTIKKILSDIGAGQADQVATAASRKRNTRRRREYYFIPKAGSSIAGTGVWVRKGRTIAPALFFVTGISYPIRFRFDEVARRSARVHFPREFEKSWRIALSRRAPR